MYASVSSTTLDSENASDIPEWKKLLLMKKRSHLNSDDHSPRTPDISRNGALPPRTVTIGETNVELRSVQSPDASSDCESETEDCEDLQYGPGIVDRLRERFLSMGAQKPRKPAVRRFSSLENLPYRVNARRPNGFKIGSGGGSVKKAQSMETLIWSVPEPTAGRRTHDSMAEEPPKAAPVIREDELPKPDTVKHVKMLFESSPPDKGAPRFRKTTPTSAKDQPERPAPPEPESRPPPEPPRRPPAATPSTSVVFDFRGRGDVQPHVAMAPAPFGCRPAKVSKRAGSPDWDEMDVGADLPPVSGIVFAGENVKVGRGAFLETRNKKLTIQFDDQATSTFEYPSENASPSPMDDRSPVDSAFDSSVVINSPANSRLGLSNYTPQILSSDLDFHLGVSQPNHRPILLIPNKNEVKENVPTLDTLVPAKPEESDGWSATESADILF